MLQDYLDEKHLFTSTATGLRRREGRLSLVNRQGLCLRLVQAHHMGLPMTGKSELCNKELQCIPEFQLQLNKTTTRSEISSWEWTQSHPPPKWCSSNLRFPHASFLCTNIAKRHKLLSWQNTQEWNMAMSNVFLKTGWNLRIALKMSPKMNSKKGVALRMHLGIIYWRNDTILEKLTQSNMYTRNQLQWGGEATSCLRFI